MKRALIMCSLLFVMFAAPLMAIARQATPGAATPAADAAASCFVGRQDDGSIILPTNQSLTPAGQQVEFLGRPNDVAVRPDGGTAAYLTTFDPEAITVVDLTTGAVRQELNLSDSEDEEAGGGFTGILYSPEGDRLFASATNDSVYVLDVAADGALSTAATIELPAAEGMEAARPGGLALAEDGNTLYVALNMNNTLGVIDVEAGALTGEIPVGNAPYGVVLVGNKAYVSNQGGRPAEDADFTNLSGGTEIVADPTTGGVTSGTVSVVDLAAGEQISTIDVGLLPNAMLLDDGHLFVANANSDSVSVIDTTTDEVVKTIQVQVFPGAVWGSSPNALAMLDDRLVVSLGRNNALAFYEWEGPDQPVRFQGLVPTGWYPGAVAIDETSDRLIVANTKGVGSLGPEQENGPEATNPTGAYVHSNLGSTSLIPVPDDEALAGYTGEVYRNNQWSGNAACSALERADAQGAPDAAAVALPRRVGDPSTIKHVFYIIKENRTYDQVFGDMPQGNGDPSLVQFGREVTPNQHALAEQFQLFDNLYVAGSLSADGHQWVTQAYVTDYIEKSFADFARAYPFNGADAMAYAPSGFLWENALRQNLTVRAYGEYANQFTDEDDPFGDNFGDWTDWYHDYQVLRGEQTGDLNFPLGQYQTRTDVPSLDPLLNRDYPPYSMQIPDVYRAELFLEEFAEFEQNGDLPNLVMMLLPADHTAGTTPDMPTPDAMVADNDLALGRIIEAITESSYWPESAIFIIEDDAQNGVDHVDGHRTTGFVISPYVKRGVVASNYYTQIDFVRTIEQILGLPPMNQMDLAATPMWDVFTDTPDLTPFTALPNEVPLDQMNPDASAAMSDLERAWIAAIEAMGFASYADIETGPDAKDENVLNRAIWYATKGYDTPYPGDARVLMPDEVEPAEEHEEEEEGELGRLTAEAARN